jgi:hypothetical protein
MTDNNDSTTVDFGAVFQAEMTPTPAAPATPPVATPPASEEAPVTPTPAAPTPPADDVTPPAPTPPAENAGTPAEKTDEEKAAEAEAELLKSETPEETANRHAKEAEGELPKYATKEDVIDAMREYNKETTGRVEQIHQARDEVISTLHPEGIDRNIYDTEGRVIKTAQDIVDRGLINERTGEAYTYEEAASFVLEANRQMDKNIEELNSWAEDVAEQNISLVEGNKRVMEKWGDVLKAMPELAKELAEEYITTQLEFDKTGSYITRKGMEPEKYYDRVLAPYKQYGQAIAEKNELEAKLQSQQQQSEQAERNGIPPQRGTSDVKANTGDPMLDALVDELKKG